LAFDVIPQDPTRPEYRQGTKLGDDHKHWLRAKFFEQYRLFFRYHAVSKLIVFAWVNDEVSKMLEAGHPPDDWNQLLAEAQADGQRLQRFAVTNSVLPGKTT
jgi:toxin YhaV